MIRNVLLIISISIFIACKGDPQKTEISTEDSSTNVAPQAKIMIAGNWINEKYYDNIKSNKSPRQAQRSCEVCFVKIPSNTGQTVEVILNFHEAIENIVVIKKNNQFQLWETEHSKPVRIIDSITLKANKKIKIGEDTFVRIKSTDDSNNYNILEQLLFNGVYLTEEGAHIAFNKNGKVTGLGEYEYYEPVLDYNDIGRDVDQIILGKTKSDMKPFAFKYKKKKLQIFALDCKSSDNSGTCVEVEFGERLYNLKKAK